MIKNVIFDFGNVITIFSPEKMTKPYVEKESEIKLVSDVVFDRIYWDRLDRGTISDEEVKAGIRSRLGEELGEVGCRVYDNWMFNLEPVEGIRDIILSLKKSGKKLYILSDISIGFANGYKRVGWLNELFSNFDGFVFSGTVGMVKPSEEIFRHLLDTYALEADECLFIDDRKANIDGANSVGIRGIVFDGNCEELKKRIGEMPIEL